MSNCFNTWLGRPWHAPEDTPLDELRIRALLTSRCRYRAASRINVMSRFSFYATVLLSLGLIIIPLHKLSGAHEAFSEHILNAMEVFLATAVLVFSAVTSVAQYELRTYLLNKCGRELKRLAGEISGYLAFTTAPNANELFYAHRDYSDIYTRIAEDAENHTNVDYRLALLSMPDYYAYPKVRRFIYWFVTLWILFIPYVIPVAFIVLEGMFIVDMFGDHCSAILSFLPAGKG